MQLERPLEHQFSLVVVGGVSNHVKANFCQHVQQAYLSIKTSVCT